MSNASEPSNLKNKSIVIIYLVFNFATKI